MKVRLQTLNKVDIDTEESNIAWLAVFHFFISAKDSGFLQLYDAHLVDTYDKEDAVYVMCSQYLFDNEFYISELLDTGKAAELQSEILSSLAGQIHEIM
jgi:hypothetical protein